MGNPVRRLENVLNCLADTAIACGVLERVEAVVTDWGSSQPLGEAVCLSPEACRIVRFVEVPPDLAKIAQADSAYPEVIALNTAARHSRGKFVGRIDQDTVVGREFLVRFFAWCDRKAKPPCDLEKGYLFSLRRQIPFAFASSEPNWGGVQDYIAAVGRLLVVERECKIYFENPVGIMLISKRLWEEIGGYDERLIYWGWMECDLAYRVQKIADLVDITDDVACSFFHQEHYDPATPRVTPRKRNPQNRAPMDRHPNSATWGLKAHAARISTGIGDPKAMPGSAQELVAADATVTAAIRRARRDAFIRYKRFVRERIWRLFCALFRVASYWEYLKRVWLAARGRTGFFS